MLGTPAEPWEVEGLVGVAVAAHAPAGSRLGHVQPVFGGQHYEWDLAAGLLLVAGVALVHLHKAGEQPAALGGIGGLGADGQLLGADLDLRPAGRAHVVVPARMPWEPPGEAHTLVVPADSPEPMMTYFVSLGGLVYLDSIESGKPIAYDDGFTLLDIARKYYCDIGRNPDDLAALCR